jgi:hypothetical protein
LRSLLELTASVEDKVTKLHSHCLPVIGNERNWKTPRPASGDSTWTWLHGRGSSASIRFIVLRASQPDDPPPRIPSVRLLRSRRLSRSMADRRGPVG